MLICPYNFWKPFSNLAGKCNRSSCSVVLLFCTIHSCRAGKCKICTASLKMLDKMSILLSKISGRKNSNYTVLMIINPKRCLRRVFSKKCSLYLTLSYSLSGIHAHIYANNADDGICALSPSARPTLGMSCQQHLSHHLNKAPAEGELEKARQEIIKIKALNGKIYSLDTC